MLDRNLEGASATYRGYRNQALYVLARLTTDANSEQRIYRPEGAEDLAVFDSSQRLIEVVQVKDYSSDLALSHFKPSRPDGFFARFKRRRIDHPNCVTRLASFGPLGPEFSGAISGDASHRKSVVRKLHCEKSPITDVEASEMLDALRGQIERPVASDLRAAVLAKLEGTIAGGHAQSTLDLLMYWVFDASEGQRDLTRAGLLLQLERIGAYLAALRDSSQEWGISVRPVRHVTLTQEDTDRLRHEYRQGVQAQWEHILADADCRRAERLAEIHRQLQSRPILIVRGASGQGKSSLGWRYLHDYCAEGLRFHVRLIEGREHALRVANALRAHVTRLRLQAVVFLDLSPADTGWPDLVRELALAGLKVLVTVREEDFHRAGLAVGDFDYTELALDRVTRAEAEPIFASLRAVGNSTALDFEEAWSRFSACDGGPLLEFTHLVTEGESLASRIRSQVLRLQRDAAAGQNGVTPAHLDLLALAAVANAAGSRVDLSCLCHAVGLQPITRPLGILENEYLLRVRDFGDCATVAGLHILRSRAVLAALLEECPEQWITYARRSLPLVVDEDIEPYLLTAFSHHPEAAGLLKSDVRHLALRSWTHAGGIARALIWDGVSRYERENRQTILDAIAKYDSGWSLICDAYIGLSDNVAKEILESFNSILGGSVRPIELTPKENVFESFANWAAISTAPPDPTRPLDWVNAGDVAFWIGHRAVNGPLRSAVEKLLPSPLPTDISLHELASFVSGREHLGDANFLTWHGQHQTELVKRFVTETDSIHIADDGHEVKVYFSVRIAESGVAVQTEDIDWHTETMKRVRLLRMLFPHRDTFGAQGIGLEVLSDLIRHDPTFKQIPAKGLPEERAVRLNAMFGNLVSYRHQRPETWRAYTDAILAFREAVSSGFRQLHKGWSRLLSEAVPQANTIKKLPVAELDRIKALSKLPMLPRAAVDEWGFVSEGRELKSHSIATGATLEDGLRRFESWRKSFRDFESGVTHVADHVVNPTVFYLAQRRNNAAQNAEDKDAPRLLANLASAWEALRPMQREFRQLFGEVCSRSQLSELEEHERINLRHLWAATIAICHEGKRHSSNTVFGIEAEMARYRQQFLDALVVEIGAVLADAGSAKVRDQPWEFDDTPHLCVICDHTSLATINQTSPKVVEAIWRATQTRAWLPQEWRPLVVEWPKIAVVHLVQGRALQPACATLFTSVLFGTEISFDVELHHYVALPMSATTFVAAGFELWDRPLIRALMALHQHMTAFTLTNTRFWPLAQFITDNSLGEDSVKLALDRFSQELSSLLEIAQRCFADVAALLETIGADESDRWKSELRRLCTIRLLSIDPNRPATINLDMFPEWIEEVENTASEYDLLMTTLITFAIDATNPDLPSVDIPQ